MFDILMYLFEYYILGEFDFKNTPDYLSADLKKEGFHQEEIENAFSWLSQLCPPSEEFPEMMTAFSTGTRIFSPWENARLTREARGFILNLEATGILNPLLRERVIERALALNVDYITLSELKLITIMVLGACTEGIGTLESAEGLREFLLSDQTRETSH